MRYGWILCLLLAACNATEPSPTAVSDSIAAGRAIVAWEQEGDLFVWQSAQAGAQRVLSGEVVQPFLSPDGARIAFTRGANRAPETLWVVDATGGEARQLAPPEPGTQIGDVIWRGRDTLYFNTLAQAQPAFIPNHDLHRADIASGTVTQVLSAGEGGRIHISPDERHILLVHPGRYGETDARIRRYEPGSNQAPRTLLAFPSVAAASEFAFSPGIFWEPDSSAARVAIPDADAVYSEINATGTPPVQLWRLRLGAADSAENIGAVQASFFGLPRWSDDATQMLYLQRDAAGVRLILAEGAGANPQPYLDDASDLAGNEIRWLPDRDTFVYPAGDGLRYLLGRAGVEPVSLSEEPLLLPHFISRQHYLAWTAFAAGSAELRLVEIDGTSTTIISSSDDLPQYDAVWLDS